LLFAKLNVVTYTIFCSACISYWTYMLFSSKKRTSDLTIHNYMYINKARSPKLYLKILSIMTMFQKVKNTQLG